MLSISVPTLLAFIEGIVTEVPAAIAAWEKIKVASASGTITQSQWNSAVADVDAANAALQAVEPPGGLTLAQANAMATVPALPTPAVTEAPEPEATEPASTVVPEITVEPNFSPAPESTTEPSPSPLFTSAPESETEAESPSANNE